MADRFDVIVVGAGPGGYVAAIRAVQLGMKVACVDKNPRLGGTCLNIGCIPSKALLESSELLHFARTRFAQHGIQAPKIDLDLPRMLARKNEIVKSLTDGVAYLLRKNKISVFTGLAKLAGKNKLIVSGDKTIELEANHIILATGSEPSGLPFLPFDGNQVVSSTEALSFERVPDQLIVIGAGYIGLELGSVWSRLGSKVTFLEFLPRLLPLNDSEVALGLHRSLEKQGLEFHLSTKVTGATKQANKITVQAEQDGKKLEFTGDRVLVSVGRKPVSAGLGLEQLGIQVEAKTGKIPVNDHYQTSVPSIYAIGDLIAGPMLAHKASEEGIAVAELLAGKAGHVNYGAIPSVIYTHPEVAAVGFSEDDLKANSTNYKVGKFPFSANGRAKALDDTEGFVKILTDAHTDRLLGMHIIGPRAGDLLAEGVLGIEFHATAEDLARTSHAHPGLAESVGEAARGAWATMIQL